MGGASLFVLRQPLELLQEVVAQDLLQAALLAVADAHRLGGDLVGDLGGGGGEPVLARGGKGARADRDAADLHLGSDVVDERIAVRDDEAGAVVVKSA